jgi:hypothetical protein
MLAVGFGSLLARAVLLKAGEKIKAVEPHALHGGFPVEAEGSVLALDPTAELPVRLHDEGRNRALLRHGTNEAIQFRASEQII